MDLKDTYDKTQREEKMEEYRLTTPHPIQTTKETEISEKCMGNFVK